MNRRGLDVMNMTQTQGFVHTHFMECFFYSMLSGLRSRSVKEKEWLETLSIFGITKEDGKRIIGRLGHTLLNEHEKLFGSYWRSTFGPLVVYFSCWEKAYRSVPPSSPREALFSILSSTFRCCSLPRLGADPRANLSPLGKGLVLLFNTRSIRRGNLARSPRDKADFMKHCFVDLTGR